MDDTLSQIPADTLERYLSGSASAEECATVAAWMAASPRAAAIVEAVRGTTGADRVAIDLDRGWTSVSSRMRAGAEARNTGRTVPERGQIQTSSWWTRLSGGWIAAVTVFAIVTAGAATLMLRSSRSVPATHYYHTSAGERSTVRLDDGSTILLAPATTVAMTPAAIEVTGEAYFTVVANPTRPYVIHTRNAIVRVLGTRFEVRQFADEPMSRVVVEDGRVAVQPRAHEASRDVSHNGHRDHTVASAGVLAVVSDSGVTLTSGVATHALTGWVRGTLVFDHVPLREVVAEIARVYGAHVRVRDSALAAARVIAEVDVNESSLVDVLGMLGEVMSAHYVEDRGAFVMVPGRRARSDDIERTPDHRFPQPERQYGR